MNRFAVIAALLLVPPVGIWVTELAFLGWWIDVAAVLRAKLGLCQALRGGLGWVLPYWDHLCRPEKRI